MLRGIDPLLTGELLLVLDRLGHGDELALVDRNFPCHRYQVPVIEMRGSGIEQAAAALFQVFPLDDFVDEPILRMQVDGEPDTITAVSAALREQAARAEGRAVAMGSVERHDFYDRCRGALALVQTGEAVGYSCYLLRKGVVR